VISVPPTEGSASDRSPAEAVPVHEGLFTAAGLLGGHCDHCRRRHFPRATTCPWCGHDHVDEVTLSPEGSLWAWTAVNTAPPGYEGEVPYGFGVVELAPDSLRVVTRLLAADPSRLREGMPMRLRVVPLTAGTTTWAFEPA
jgi:uncharacterized OB-fold protein